MKIDQKSPHLEQFVDKLIEEKKFPNLDDEVLAQLRADLMSRLEDRINAALISNMTYEQLQEFDKLLERNNELEVQNYLRQAIPDLETVIATALINFRSTYLGLNA
jgi:Arc/MetJ-type ribon-helix-helix transcriptional regulator